MPRHGADTFCCGAGGGRIWMGESDAEGERPSEQRIREAQTLGRLDYFLVSCPKDLAMYSDAATTLGAEFEVAELTALIELAMTQAEQREAEPRTSEAEPLTSDQPRMLVSSSATSNRSATTP